MFFFYIILSLTCFFFFFFNDTATTEIYTLSLHDALPIFLLLTVVGKFGLQNSVQRSYAEEGASHSAGDRKSTRLNSSHQIISYAVFCLKKKKQTQTTGRHTPSVRSPDARQRSTTGHDVRS